MGYPNSSSQSYQARILNSASITKKPQLNPSVSRKINVDYHHIAMQNYAKSLKGLRPPKSKNQYKKDDEQEGYRPIVKGKGIMKETKSMNKNLSDMLLMEMGSLGHVMSSQDKVRMMNRAEYNEMIKRNAALIDALLLQNKQCEPTMFVNHLWGNVYRGTVAGLFGKNQVGQESD